MAALSMRLFGPFEVELDGEPVTGFVTDKARALLAYLAVEADRPHRREALAGLLWPEAPERSARGSLRTALGNVRQLVGDRARSPDQVPSSERGAGLPFLHVSWQEIQFNRDSDAWVDVRVFSELMQAGTLRPSDEPLGPRTSQDLEEAVGLYRGSFLEGFSLPDGAPFEEWALLKREELQRQMLWALQQLIGHYERSGEIARALPHAWRAMELDPWRGVAQRQLMHLLALDGQREAALAQYEQHRQLLAEELGVEPSEAARELYEVLSTGAWPDGTSLAGTMSRRDVTIVGPCPYRGLAAFPEADAPFFFGRAAFVGQLFEAVQRRSLVAVVVGSSGSGKSSTVFAGLLPRLHAEADWLVVDARPGSYPFRAVAGALTSALEPDLTETERLLETQKLATALQQGEVDLYHVAMRALEVHSQASRLLLVVDQFEELYTLCPEPERQRRFLEVLLAAVQAGSGQRRSPLVLLLTLRADFMGQALAHRPFADALQDGSLLLGPMNREELRTASALTQGESSFPTEDAGVESCPSCPEEVCMSTPILPKQRASTSRDDTAVAWRHSTLAHALACLVDPPALAAIVLLLLNDHVLKAAVPSWLTGKLSDVAGLYFFPFLVLAGLGLLERVLPRRFRSPRRAWRIALALSGLWFLALKATPASNALAVAALDGLLGGSHHVVADATDLIALAMLPLAWLRWRRITARWKRRPARGDARRLRWSHVAALALASLATVATPPPRTFAPPVSFGCVFDVAADAQRGDTFYASLATYRVTDWGGPDSGQVETEQTIQTYRSEDGGRTWELYVPLGGRLWADPHTSDRLYVLNEAGLHVVEGGQARRLEVPFEALDARVLRDYETEPDVLPSRHALAFDPATPGVLYLTDGARILKSSDGGETWDSRPVGVPAGRLMALGLAPSAPLTLYVAADDANIRQSYVVRSDGGGYTWAQPHRFGRAPHLRAVTVHPGSAEIAYAAGFGVHRTVDGGGTWQSLYRANLWNIALDPDHPDIIVAAGFQTMAFSDDGGDTWFSPDALPSWDVAVSPVTPHRTVLALCSEGVAVRPSLTDTLTAPTSGPTPPLGLARSDEPTVVYAGALAFGPDDPRTLYALTGDPPLLSRSDDGGASWISHPLTRTLPDPPTALAARPLRPAVPGSSTGAPASLVALGRRTTYSLTWRADGVTVEGVGLPEGGAVAGARPLLAAPSDPDLLLTTAPGGVLRSEDGGETWSAHRLSATAAISQPTALALGPAGPSDPAVIVYAAADLEREGTREQVILRSDDGGITWEPRSALTETQRLTTLTVHPADPDIVYGGGVGLYQSRDGAASWTTLDPEMQVRWLAIPPTEPRVLYAVTDEGVARSTDEGVTWTALCPSGRFNGPAEFLVATVAPLEPHPVVLLARPTRPDVRLPALGTCSAPEGPRYDLRQGWQRFSEGLPVFVEPVEE